MNIEKEIRKLLNDKKRLEQRLKDLDAKVDHLIFLHKESRRCVTRKCPLDYQENRLNDSGSDHHLPGSRQKRKDRPHRTR